MTLPVFQTRAYAGTTLGLQLGGNVQASDTTMTLTGTNTGWPTGNGTGSATAGPFFTVRIDGGLPSEEKVLCTSFNLSTGLLTVYNDGTNTGRGYDGSTATAHVPQPSLAEQVQLCWTAVEAKEANTTAVTVMGGAAAGSPGQVLTISSGLPVWATPGGSGAGLWPIGMVGMWPGSGSSGGALPSGFFVCNGQAVSRTTYATLFGIISTTYGTGDGSTTFNLPNIGDHFPIGTNPAALAAPNQPANNTVITTAVGNTGGTTAIAVNQLPAHTHVNTLTEPNSGTGHNHASAAPASGFVVNFEPTTLFSNSGTSGDHSPAMNQTVNTNTGNSVTGLTLNNASVGGGQAYTPPYLGLLFAIRAA